LKRSDAEWWIGTGSRQDGAITRVIEYQGQFVGSVGITPQNGWRDHLGELGYWVAEEHWGKGIREAILKAEVQKDGIYYDTHHFVRHLSRPAFLESSS
jgi:RimJ/RimL family protein N-acetyltransferase